MYAKFKNLKNGKEFTVSEAASQHYKGDKKFLYLGTSDENGVIKERSEAVLEDLGSIEEQLKSVRTNLEKKSPVQPAEASDLDKSDESNKTTSSADDNTSEEEEDEDED